MPITADQLLHVMPRAVAAVAAGVVDVLNEQMPRWGITTDSDVAAFLAQAAHESSELTSFRENLNYSAEALGTKFGKHFWLYSDEVPECPADKRPAHDYARQPQRIANWLYAGRYGNGDEASGDGWAYRGGGIFQITFAANYSAASTATLGDDTLVRTPDLITQPKHAVATGCWYWQSRGLTDLANRGGFEEITRKIQGGLDGQPQRLRYLNLAVEALTGG